MSVTLYVDVHIPRAITEGLRLRGIDVLATQEDGAARLPDPALLDRASDLERIPFTLDADVLREATRRQRSNETFAGLVYAHPLRVTIGQCLRDLERIAPFAEPEDFRNWVEYLPLR